MSKLQALISLIDIKVRNKLGENHPSTITFSDVKNVRDGIRDSRTVSFDYTRKYDGNTKKYLGIEPYEVKKGLFYGFHKRHGAIHSFKMNRISKVILHKTEFEKRKF